MSLGYGATQRRVLEALASSEQEWVSVQALAGGKDADGRVNASAVESTRRAVHRLEDDGLVQTTLMDDRTDPGSNDKLFVRLVEDR